MNLNSDSDGEEIDNEETLNDSITTASQSEIEDESEQDDEHNETIIENQSDESLNDNENNSDEPKTPG